MLVRLTALMAGILVMGAALAGPADDLQPAIRIVAPVSPRVQAGAILVAPVPGSVADACARGTLRAVISRKAIEAVTRTMPVMRLTPDEATIVVEPPLPRPGLRGPMEFDLTPEPLDFPSVPPTLKLR